MKVVKNNNIMSVRNATVDNIRTIMEMAGNNIGSVYFVKRSTGELRKMCYRLHVNTPSFANKPKGISNHTGTDIKNTQITVFDVNNVKKDKNGNSIYQDGKICRGDWRTVPLENVKRIKVNGIIFEVESFKA